MAIAINTFIIHNFKVILRIKVNYCLLTHRRGAHRKLFWPSLLILKSKFWPNVALRSRYAAKG